MIQVRHWNLLESLVESLNGEASELLCSRILVMLDCIGDHSIYWTRSFSLCNVMRRGVNGGASVGTGDAICCKAT